jgi:hypothetical protein
MAAQRRPDGQDSAAAPATARTAGAGTNAGTGARQRSRKAPGREHLANMNLVDDNKNYGRNAGSAGLLPGDRVPANAGTG